MDHDERNATVAGGLARRLRGRVPELRAPAWIALFLGLNLLYFHLVFDTLNIPFCCDANHYRGGWRGFLKDGLLFENAASGYRSIANYVLAGLIEAAGSLLRPGNGYPAGAVAIYALTGIGLILGCWRMRGFAEIFAPIYLNPVAFAYVPYPLQESQFVLVLCPLLVATHLFLRGGSPRAAIVALWLLAAVAWLLKGSLLLVAVPLAAIAMVLALRTKGGLAASAAGIVCLVALLAPQSWIAMQKFGTPYPYPDARNLSAQIVWGHRDWRFETAMVDGKWAGRHLRAPFGRIHSTREYFQRLRANPTEIAALWVGHVVGAFDHSELRVYIVDQRPAFSVFNVVVGMVIALGLAQWLALVRTRTWGAVDAVHDSLLFGGAALLPLLAVETRFSLLPMLMLTLRAWQWIRRAGANPAMPSELVLAFFFGLVFSLATTLMNFPAAG